MKKVIVVHDKMQSNYRYELTAKPGQDFHANFLPELTPQDMLELGVFGGKYMTDCTAEFPQAWFDNAKLCATHHNPTLNFFGVNASQSLKQWQAKGWLYSADPRGWFQWYCRYYQGRRSPDDERQIKRWRAMRRHIAQIKNNCPNFVWSCRKKQRQALLHWAYDSRRI
ncbi:MAG: hypothetical protein ACKVH8_24855 [Pirellulales bacterium]